MVLITVAALVQKPTGHSVEPKYLVIIKQPYYAIVRDHTTQKKRKPIGPHSQDTINRASLMVADIHVKYAFVGVEIAYDN